LHVLGTPPAFVLSQDQTLREELLRRVVRNVRSFGRPQTVSRPANTPCPGSVPGGTRPLHPRSAGTRPDRIPHHPSANRWAGAQSTQGAPERKTGSILAPPFEVLPKERSSDGVEPGHIFRPRFGRRVCMLLSFQRPSHLFRKAIFLRMRPGPWRGPGADRRL
jgi:hypothetical protein